MSKTAANNLTRAADHLETVDSLCSSIMRRISTNTEMTQDWLNTVVKTMAVNIAAAQKIAADEAIIANGYSRNFLAELDKGLEFGLGGQGQVYGVTGKDGNVVQLGFRTPHHKNTGGDCA